MHSDHSVGEIVTDYVLPIETSRYCVVADVGSDRAKNNVIIVPLNLFCLQIARRCISTLDFDNLANNYSQGNTANPDSPIGTQLCGFLE